MADQAEKLRELAHFNRNGNEQVPEKVRVITITSGKGGVGKSNLTVNLALSFAKRGKRVVIFDADFGFANVDILLGLVPHHNMYHVVRGEKKLSEIILAGPLGIRLVPGSTGLLEMAHLSVLQRQQLLRQLLELEGNTDIILIDTGAGISKAVLGFIAAATDVLLITNPEPTSITDAYGVAKIIGTHKLHKEVKLIVNQVKNRQEGDEVAHRIAQVAKQYLPVCISYLGYIVSDRVVNRSVREQCPFCIAYPNSKVTHCVEELAKNLLAEQDHAPSDLGMKGFLSKIVKIFS